MNVRFNHSASDGENRNSQERRPNFVDSIPWMFRSHSVKFGGDYRRVMPGDHTTRYDNFFEFSTCSSRLRRCSAVCPRSLEGNITTKIRIFRTPGVQSATQIIMLNMEGRRRRSGWRGAGRDFSAAAIANLARRGRPHQVLKKYRRWV
jgi:hypothetical protein